MALPPSFNTGTVKGKIVNYDGTPAQGFITLEPRVRRIVVSADETVVVPSKITITLDSEGSFVEEVPATDDPDVTPLNFTYSVTEVLNHGQGSKYDLEVPVGGVVDISSILSGVPASGGAIIAKGDPGPSGDPGPPGPSGDPGPPGPPLKPKGTVPTSGDLPETDNEEGDFWVAEDTGHAWGWTGTEWVDLGFFGSEGGGFPDLVANLAAKDTAHIAHRCGAGTVPENAMVSSRIAVAAGIDALECDVQLLADGALVLMHDTSAERTTGIPVDVDQFSSVDWVGLDVAATIPWHGPEPAPFLVDFLDAWLGRVPLLIEPKSPEAMTALLALLDSIPGAYEGVVVQAYNTSLIAPVVAAGFRCYRYYGTTVNASDLADAVAAGVHFLGCNASAADAELLKLTATGLPVWCFGATRRSARDRVLGLGASGVMTDEPVYTPRSTAIRQFSSWQSGKLGPGLLNTHTAHPIGLSSGEVRLSNTDAQGIMVGEVSPIAAAAGSYTVAVEVMTEAVASGDGVWLAVCTDDGAYYFEGSGQGTGYQVYLNAVTGQMSVRQTTAPSTNTLLGGNYNTAAPVAEQWMELRFIVTPTTVRGRREDTGSQTAEFANTASRGGYVHLGKVGPSPARFRNLSIVPN